MLQVERVALEREKEEPRTKEMVRQLAAAAKAVDSIAATHGQLAMRLREAEAEAGRRQGSGAPELPFLQLQMRGLARRCARRCAWVEPRARLCRHLALLEAGLPLSLRTDAVGSGDPGKGGRQCGLPHARTSRRGGGSTSCSSAARRSAPSPPRAPAPRASCRTPCRRAAAAAP